MVIALVQIPLPGPKRPRERALARALESTKILRNVKGLRRQYQLDSEAGGAGLYEFASRADAAARFDGHRALWMYGRFGVGPTLTIFCNPVVLDSEAGEVRVEGRPVPAAWQATKTGRPDQSPLLLLLAKYASTVAGFSD